MYIDDLEARCAPLKHDVTPGTAAGAPSTRVDAANPEVSVARTQARRVGIAPSNPFSSMKSGSLRFGRSMFLAPAASARRRLELADGVAESPIITEGNGIASISDLDCLFSEYRRDRPTSIKLLMCIWRILR